MRNDDEGMSATQEDAECDVSACVDCELEALTGGVWPRLTQRMVRQNERRNATVTRRDARSFCILDIGCAILLVVDMMGCFCRKLNDGSAIILSAVGQGQWRGWVRMTVAEGSDSEGSLTAQMNVLTTTQYNHEQTITPALNRMMWRRTGCDIDIGRKQTNGDERRK